MENKQQIPKYLVHYLNKRCDRTLFELVKDELKDVEIIIVVPAYKESFEELAKTIDSVCRCTTKVSFQVYVLINYKENDDLEIKDAADDLLQQVLVYIRGQKLPVIAFKCELKGKKVGVGMARKMLMDTALLTFTKFGRDGLIINLDADTIVQDTYPDILHKTFKQHPTIEAASIAFHHPSSQHSEPILLYELHLRYFINMQRLLELPYAFQTVGSAMAVRASAYAKEGGMNLRQAGEDFYFVHKFTKNQSLMDINSTGVFPSGRSSDRVPFGTGKAVIDINALGPDQYKTYNPKSFNTIKKWLVEVELALISQEVNPPLSSNVNLDDFLKQHNYPNVYQRMLKGSNEARIRIKMFYNWFDAFLLMKCLHHLRDAEFHNVTIPVALDFLFDQLMIENSSSLYESLITLKEFDEKQDYRNQWSAGLNAKLSRTSASLSTHHSKR